MLESPHSNCYIFAMLAFRISEIKQLDFTALIGFPVGAFLLPEKWAWNECDERYGNAELYLVGL